MSLLKQQEKIKYDKFSFQFDVKTSVTFTVQVYPQVLFDGAQLDAGLTEVTPDGVFGLVAENENLRPLVSMSLFGRVYGMDPNIEDQHCPQI